VRRDGFRDRVTLTFNLLTPGSMHVVVRQYDGTVHGNNKKEECDEKVTEMWKK